MTFAISLYDLSVWVHISAVVVGFGATFAEALAFPVAMKLSPRHLPYVHALQLAINRMLASPALLVIIVTGIYQVDKGGYSMGDAWISATFAIAIVLGGLAGAVFGPTEKKLLALAQRDLEQGQKPSDAYEREAIKLARFGGLGLLLVTAALFLMITKPGA